MDYDRIMVMDSGRVAEIGRPRDLLANPKSMLSQLVDSTGVAAAAQLRLLANQAGGPAHGSSIGGNGTGNGIVPSSSNGHIATSLASADVISRPTM
jgi:ABC-type proline/glycine betaine transport system ATPase subunit